MNKGGSECRSMQGQHVVISWHGYQFALILLLQARISIKVNPSTKRWHFFGATPRRGVGQKRGQWHESIVLITNMQLPHRARRACFASSSWKLVASLSSSWTATSPERGERERLLQSNSYSNHYFRVYPTNQSSQPKSSLGLRHGKPRFLRLSSLHRIFPLKRPQRASNE